MKFIVIMVSSLIVCSAQARGFDYAAYNMQPSPAAEQFSHYELLSRRGDVTEANRGIAKVKMVLARHFGVSIANVDYLGQTGEPTVPGTVYSVADVWTCVVLLPGMGPGVNCQNSQTGARTSFRY